MVLPLNLAMTASEIAATPVLPERIAWMSCHFCACSDGIANIPEALPKNAMLILTDRESCAGHSRDLVTQQLLDTVQQFHCESVLLDFQRPWDSESDAMVKAVVEALPCPVAVSEGYAKDLSCPVFLAPCPLHAPLEGYLRPWKGRTVWLEAALCQETITVTKDGVSYAPVFPTQALSGGFHDRKLHCRYHISVSPDRIRFTLFDTPETMLEKLAEARSLGVCRMVGFYQELGTFLRGNQSS